AFGQFQPADGAEYQQPIQPADEAKAVEGKLQERPDLEPFRGHSRPAKEPRKLCPDLLEVAGRALGSTQAGAFQVVDAMPLCQPAGDVVARGAILRSPGVAEIEDGQPIRLVSATKRPRRICPLYFSILSSRASCLSRGHVCNST